MRFPAVQVRRVARVTLGKMLQSQPTSELDIERPYLRAAHVQPEGRVVHLDDDQVMWFRPGELRDLDLRPNDVVIVEGGAGYGRSGLIRDGHSGSGFQNSIVRVRPLPGLSHGPFVDYALQSALAEGRIKLVASTATIPHFTAEKVAAFLIPRPPLDEQRAIADYLDRETAEIDLLIEKQTVLIDRLRERRLAVIETSVAKGVRVGRTMRNEDSWMGTVPSDWAVGNIRRFASMHSGHTPSRSNPDYWTDCYIPWFTLADVWQLREGATYLGKTKSTISDLGLANSAAELLPAGTVILSRTASVGFAGIMPRPMATSQDFWNWVCGPLLLPEYLVNVFRAMHREFAALRHGSTHQTIYQGSAASFRIPVPPRGEQKEIADHINRETGEIDKLIVKTERFIELTKERRSALITAAVTGQMNVTAKMGAA